LKLVDPFDRIWFFGLDPPSGYQNGF